MKLEELKKCLEGMTEGNWDHIHISSGLESLTIPMDNGEHYLVGHFNGSRNDAKGIAMLRNHADDLLDLAQTVKKLRNEVSGLLSIGEYAIRQDVGNTNYECVKLALQNVEEALSKIEFGAKDDAKIR